MTVDTAGSQIDTLIGVYMKDGADFVEVGCIDDVFTQPLGTTYQAALTIDTVTGTTYYVEIGGYRSRAPSATTAGLRPDPHRGALDADVRAVVRGRALW